jgi:hypothetical protein
VFSLFLITVDVVTDCNAGLGHLVAKNEEEYVQSALQLASDIAALSNLRMSLRDLMSKSPVCDGPNFTLGLETTYRNMWHRYCKGDVPSLRRIELLQQQEVPKEVPIKNTDSTRITSSRDGPPESIKANGFSAVSLPKVDHTINLG